MRLNLMIEGQEDISWDQWVSLARVVEDSGLEGLFRSDHYLSVQGDERRGSLDAWATLAGLAAVTDRIRLGTMVSPVTFRHPSVLAKAVTTVDHISGGRVELGMGAGWHEQEHTAYGFPFPDAETRFEVLAEQMELVVRQWTDERLDFAGKHYRVDGLSALPKPLQHPHPNLIVGGMGNKKSAALAARWAGEYNTVFPTLEAVSTRRRKVERAWEEAGRDPAELVFSVMTGCVVGSDADEVRRRAQTVMSRTGEDGDVEAWIAGVEDEWVVGTTAQVVQRLRDLEGAGVQRIMLQHQDHTDLEMVSLLGSEVATAVA